MDIKYTIEILTKDIQDIGKLVGKLQNSKDASSIELDLAMSKLRNVYEILTLIKADRLSELVDKSLDGSQEVEIEAHKEPQGEQEPEPPAKAGPEAKTEPEAKTGPEVKAEPEAKTEPEVKAEPEAKTEPEVKAEPEAKTEPEAKAEPGTETEPAPGPESESENSTILAEKFQAESSINENLAGARSENLDSKLLGSAIDNIGRNIGINDRFLIIRELFDGNSDDFSRLLSRLDGAENYESASKILTSHFAGAMEHEGVEILSGLVKRRYLRQ